MEDLVEIHVSLLDEKEGKHTICEPVQAQHLKGNLYRIVSENPTPETERWEFQTGDKVRCKRLRFEGGEIYLSAYRKIEDED
jgi:hypothetical protein